jgi:hypothetical protein
MALHPRKLAEAAIATSSLFALSVPSLAQATNSTSQAGGETLANWPTFRPAHNGEEGDRDVVRDAPGVGLRLRSGTGSCVIDHYATTSARCKEIACIVLGPRAKTVVVAAARPADWTRFAPSLERAVRASPPDPAQPTAPPPRRDGRRFTLCG